jgi:hypothetical protein
VGSPGHDAAQQKTLADINAGAARAIMEVLSRRTVIAMLAL